MTSRWRVLPTVLHGMLDFAAGMALIIVALVGTEFEAIRWLLIFFGCSILLYSILTDYELGIFRVLRLRLHLAIDLVLGVVFLLLPWLIDMTRAPAIALHVIGLVSIIAGLTTRLRAQGTAVQDLIQEERP